MTDGVSLSEYSLCFTKLYVQCSKTDAWSFPIGKKFIGCLHSLSRMQWDYEPGRAQRRAGVPPAQRARQRERFRSVGVADGGRRDACPTFRCMERPISGANLLLTPVDILMQPSGSTKNLRCRCQKDGCQ